jgi:hypothetical protein
MHHFARRLVPLLLLSVVLTGCLDELAEIFVIIAYEESDDPQRRKEGETIRQHREDREAREALDSFIETGDEGFLERAIALRPDDTEYRGFAVVAATMGGDPAEIAAAKEALTLAETRRLQRLTRPGDDPVTAAQVRRNVLGEILVAQTKLLGGSLTKAWAPPGPDASPEDQQLYGDYCATRHEIQTTFDDDLSYIPLPPCPGS